MIAWRKSALALLVIPMASWSGTRLTASARALGVDLGTSLAALSPSPSVSPVPADPSTPTDSTGTAPSPDGDLLDGRPRLDPDDAASANTLAKPGNTKTSKRAGRPTQDSGAAHSLFVSQHTIIRLANARAVPTGQPVAASASRPAGIALAGVGALGIGLRDGDVLTEVAGRPARAEGQVIAAVLVALTRHERQISGVFFRGSEKWLLVVELPRVTLPETPP